jgi:membrane-associated protein
MTETLLALVPTYGVWLILVGVMLSTLAIPVPASMLVMTAGGFASTGDMVLWQVQAAALGGCMLGDQLAYNIARKGGVRLIGGLKARPRLGPAVMRAETMLARKGAVAVFLSRTVLSPLGPYMGYLSGALRFNWWAFTLAAGIGAACWAAAYSYLGYTFATRIAEIASLISNALGFVLAGCVALGLGVYLWRSYRDDRGE